jgi:hypothetical protein
METQILLNWPLSHANSIIWGAERGVCTKIEEWKKTNKLGRCFFKWRAKFISTKEGFKYSQTQTTTYFIVAKCFELIHPSLGH